MHTLRISFGILFSCGLLISAALIPLSSYAIDIPQLFVERVILEEDEYPAGSVASGTAVLYNAGPVPAPNASYIVRLIGEEVEDGTYLEAYTEESFGTVELAVGERKAVPFALTLPGGLAGDDFAVEVQASLEGGFTLGWDHAPLSISGDGVFVSIGGRVAIGDEEYGLQAGPTISAPENIELRLDVANDTEEALALKAVVTIFETLNSSDQGMQVTGQTFTIEPGEVIGTTTVMLPTFDYRPGVKQGNVHLEDETGQQRSDIAMLRYIVGGDIVNIQSVSSDVSYLTRGDTASVTVLFSGEPFNIREDAPIDMSPEDGSVEVSLVNEREQVVAEGSLGVDVQNDTSAVFDLSARRGAEALRADVRIVKADGTLLASGSFPLSSEYESLYAPDQGMDMLLIAGVAAAGIVVIGLIIYLMRSNRKPPTTPTAGIAALLFVVLAFPAGFSSAAFVETDPNWNNWQQRTGTRGPAGGLYLFINGPSNELRAGDTFYLQGSLKSWMCANQPQNTVVSVTYNGENTTKNYRHGARGGHHSVYATDRFSIGPFTVPDSGQDIDRVFVGSSWRQYNTSARAHYGDATFGYWPLNLVADDNNTLPNTPPPGTPSCSDGIDNDTDGLIDFPDDTDCAAAGDDTETPVFEQPGGDDGEGGDGGDSTASLSLSAAPPLVRFGQTTELSWTFSNVTEGSCTLSGTNGDEWSLAAVSGTVESATIFQETTFTLSCQDLDEDPVSESVTIKIVPSFEEVLKPLPDFFASLVRPL